MSYDLYLSRTNCEVGGTEGVLRVPRLRLRGSSRQIQLSDPPHAFSGSNFETLPMLTCRKLWCSYKPYQQRIGRRRRSNSSLVKRIYTRTVSPEPPHISRNHNLMENTCNLNSGIKLSIYVPSRPIRRLKIVLPHAYMSVCRISLLWFGSWVFEELRDAETIMAWTLVLLHDGLLCLVFVDF